MGVVAGVDVGEDDEDDREGFDPDTRINLLVLGTMCGTERGRCRRGEGALGFRPPLMRAPSLVGPTVDDSTVTLLGSRVTIVMVLGGDMGVMGVAGALTTMGVERVEEESVRGGAGGSSSSSSSSRSWRPSLCGMEGVDGGLGAGLAFLGGTGGGGMTSSLLSTRGEAPGDISGLRDPLSAASPRPPPSAAAPSSFLSACFPFTVLLRVGCGGCAAPLGLAPPPPPSLGLAEGGEPDVGGEGLEDAGPESAMLSERAGGDGGGPFGSSLYS